MPDTG